MTDDSELKRYFVSILSKGVKDNTYKFALARFLLEYSLKCEPDSIKKKIANNEKEVVSYQEIANAFLKYYWHQECKYRIKQNHNDAKPPSVITTIRNVFGEDYIPDSFEKMPQEKIEAAQEKIRRKGMNAFICACAGGGAGEEDLCHSHCRWACGQPCGCAGA